MSTPAPDSVKRLVDRFAQGRKVFLSGDYKEEQFRAEFLNGPCLTIRHSDFDIRTFHGPFFTALGWDMDNKQGLSETFNDGRYTNQPHCQTGAAEANQRDRV